MLNLFKRLGFGSKILFMLLLTSLFSILLTGYIGYSEGQHGLTEAVFNQLTGLRNVQAEAITNDFQRLENFVLTLSEAQMVIDAIEEFKDAIAKLQQAELTPSQQQKLTEYYDQDFIPGLLENLNGQGQPVSSTYLPVQPAEKYLQYHYIAANPYSSRTKSKLNFANDGSKYSELHRKYHYRFRNILKRMEYEDLYLIDANTGQVLYSVQKEVDFLTNIKNGPFAGSNFAEAFSKSIAARDPYYVSLVDFENYRPSLGLPKAFITTTVYDEDTLIGVLVLQLSNTRIDRVMTYQGKWQEAGLGKTGETYLVGQDKFLRTNPRLFLQDKKAYFQVLKQANFDPEQIEQIRDLDSPILAQKVDTSAVQKALNGQSGEGFHEDYRGVNVLVAYQPVKLADFRWALIAKMDEAEAFKSVYRLTRRLAITTAILIPLFTLLSIFLSRLLAHPINRLIAGTKKVAVGEKEIRVSIDSRDEIGQLAETFNGMAASLDEKEAIIARKIEENTALLLNILPEPVAKRLQSGEEAIADSFPNVTIIYGEIVGFSDFFEDISPDHTVSLLNELIGAFDETAEHYGVEKLKTVGSCYIAVCGLTIPRVDHIKRAVDFGVALFTLIRIFNQKQGSDLGLAMGIHSGPVVAGIVGKTKFIYELWGETMTITDELHDSASIGEIRVSKSVYTALQGMYAFQAVDEVTIKGGRPLPVWSLTPLTTTTAAAIERER
jgi:class 3 adenylate cyclase